MGRKTKSADFPRCVHLNWRAYIFLITICWIIAGLAWFGSRAPQSVPRTSPPGLTTALTTAASQSDGQQLCVVVRTIPAQRFALPTLLLSLFSDDATRNSIRAVVIDTDAPGQAPFEDLENIISGVNTIVGFDAVVVSSRTQEAVRTLFPQLATPDYGYLLTDAVLEDLIAAYRMSSQFFSSKLPRNPATLARTRGLQQLATPSVASESAVKPVTGTVLTPLLDHSRAGWTCEFVMTTNGDNVYAAEFFREVHHALREPPLEASHAQDAGGLGGGASMVATHW